MSWPAWMTLNRKAFTGSVKRVVVKVGSKRPDGHIRTV